MVHVKVVVVFTFILLSVVLQLRVESQPTINSFEQNSCPQLEEDRRVQGEENQRPKFEFDSERQRFKILEKVSHFQSEENQRLKVELDYERERLKNLVNVSRSQSKEIVQLNFELESKRRMVQNCLKQRATVKLSKRIEGSDSYVYSVVKVLDEIYVLYSFHNSSKSIKVFEDRNEFRLRREIALSGTNLSYDMIYSNESKCFYINDAYEKCIWRMTTEGDHRLTKWLTNVTWPNTLSLSNEGHLLLLRADQPLSQLEIYSLSANIIRSIQLPYAVKNPRDVVQTSNGYYVILHKMSNGSMVISQVNSAGQLMNRFTPRNQLQLLNDPWKLFYDSDNNRLFVADQNNHQVNLFDSNCLNWIQDLLSQETERIWYPRSVFYDAIKRQLLLLRTAGLNIYEFV